MNQNNYYAFFDVDGTILNMTSMLSFLEYSLCEYYRPFTFYGYAKFKLYQFLRKNFYDENNRDKLNSVYYKNYRGMLSKKIEQLGEKWFSQQLSKDNNLFNKAIVDELSNHQLKGANVVLVSGAFLPCLRPLADYLGIQHILCVNPFVEKGRYTGEIAYPQTIGEGKAKAIKLFLADRDESLLNRSFAYGDHISDLPMLNLVGNPAVIRGDEQLEKHALNHAWKLF
jgi:HAD superfamily hydrolase (TIGR01490 family)